MGKGNSMNGAPGTTRVGEATEALPEDGRVSEAIAMETAAANVKTVTGWLTNLCKVSCDCFVTTFSSCNGRSVCRDMYHRDMESSG